MGALAIPSKNCQKAVILPPIISAVSCALSVKWMLTFYVTAFLAMLIAKTPSAKIESVRREAKISNSFSLIEKRLVVGSALFEVGRLLINSPPLCVKTF